MPIHRILLRLLLLAVLFNTAIGLPVHEAKHLREAVVEMAQAGSLPQANDDGAVREEGEGVHGACAWCLAYAEQASEPQSAPVFHRAVAPTARPEPPTAVAFVPSPGRWRFASRDPPDART